MPKLKLEDDGKPVMVDGKLIAIGDDGGETPFDPIQNHQAMTTIREERDRFKEAAETAANELALFGKSTEDRAATLEKVRLAANLDAKKLVDAGKVEELKNQAIASYKAETERQLADKDKSIAERDGLLDQLVLDASFQGSSLFKEEFLPGVTWSLLRHELKDRLTREGTKAVGYRDAEKKERIYSATKPGALAEGDELLLAVAKTHPDFNKWKKGVNASGVGATGNTNPGDSSFDSLPVDERLARGLAKTA